VSRTEGLSEPLRIGLVGVRGRWAYTLAATFGSCPAHNATVTSGTPAARAIETNECRQAFDEASTSCGVEKARAEIDDAA
jgi:hypothetical protein